MAKRLMQVNVDGNMGNLARCPGCGMPLRLEVGPVCERCLLQTALRPREQELRDEIIQIASTAERVAYVDEVCSDDSGLRSRLRAWIAELAPETPNNLDCPPLGDHIDEHLIEGRYRLSRKIGEGGFGAVYLAEQLSPVRRQVALKLLKLGMDTRRVVTRFEQERQTLAMMDHPNIAKVFDGGATASGRPFFVMELVRGVPITAYCHEHALSIPERLGLFLQVCEAVQHAHQKGIIHRDLKPTNILVSAQASFPVLKVIDFGIAKAVGGEHAGDPAVTAEHHFLGTPAYISPEQASLGSGDIDTRSDIYSLGVLLYELLTGTTPFDTAELARVGFDEMRRIIREREPLRPSTRLHRIAARKASAGELEFTAPSAPCKIHRDLDCIVLKCLQKDRALRYATANGLAMDVERYLDHEPIVARAPSTLYRVGKTFRRHRVAMLAGAAAIAALLTGVVVSTWQAVRATRAEQQQTLLRKEVEAELNRRDGEFAAKRGDWVRAAPFYEKAIELLPDQQEFYHHLTPLLAELGDQQRYDELCREALKRFGGASHPRVAERMTKDCLILASSKADPEDLTLIADVGLKAGPKIFPVDLPWFQLAKGLAEHRCGRYTSAVEWLKKALAGAADVRADAGRVYVQVQARAVLAMSQARLGHLAEARAIVEEATSLAQTQLPQLSIYGLTDYWPDSIYAEILLREARRESSRTP